MNNLNNKQPRIVTSSIGKIQEHTRTALDNNVPLFCFNVGNEDMVQIDFTFTAGEIRTDTPMVAHSTNAMLGEGTTKLSAHKLNEVLDYYGIVYSLFCSGDKAGISMFCLNKYLNEALDLISGMLFQPKFGEEELATQIDKQRNEYMISREVVNVLAKETFASSVFGESHPYGRKRKLEDFDLLNRFKLQEFHSGNYIPENLYIVIAGKIPNNTEQLLNKYFGGITSSFPKNNPDVPLLKGEKVKRIHIPKANSVQTAIRIGSLTIGKKETDYSGLKIVNTILGGYFGSHLMKNLREEKGFTYGIGSALYSTQLTGVKIIAAEVRQENSNEAIDEIIREIILLGKKPIEKEELDIVRNYMLGSIVRSLDGPFALIDNFKSLWEYGLNNTFNYQMEEKIKNIQPDEIISLVNHYYNVDDLYIVTAGKS